MSTENEGNPMATGIKDVPRNATKKLAWAALGLAAAFVPLALLARFLTLWPALLCLLLLLVVSVAASHKATKDPGRFAGLGLARLAQGLFVLYVIAMLAPSLLRVQRSQPPPPIGELRSLVSAMQIYASSNGGYFDSRLECLVRPGGGDCIRDYEPGAPEFLDASFLEPERHGYHFTLYPGAPPDAAERPAETSPSSVSGYAYTAVPRDDNRRQLCAEANGRICTLPGDAEMAVTNGRCPAACQDLR